MPAGRGRASPHAPGAREPGCSAGTAALPRAPGAGRARARSSPGKPPRARRLRPTAPDLRGVPGAKCPHGFRRPSPPFLSASGTSRAPSGGGRRLLVAVARSLCRRTTPAVAGWAPAQRAGRAHGAAPQVTGPKPWRSGADGCLPPPVTRA
ncbi:hypothetical protein STPH1_0354 [Streptomyces sp. OM5714]|nr:hypothetical protein STPH1_0354 [Streptomyces sp. OM5714]